MEIIANIYRFVIFVCFLQPYQYNKFNKATNDLSIFVTLEIIAHENRKLNVIMLKNITSALADQKGWGARDARPNPLDPISFIFM